MFGNLGTQAHQARQVSMLPSQVSAIPMTTAAQTNGILGGIDMSSMMNLMITMMIVVMMMKMMTGAMGSVAA